MNKTDNTYILTWAKKIRAINLLGSKCSVCGNKDIFVLEFHHDKGEKDYNINSIKQHRWSKIEKEIKKCKLLCRNCHSEIHHWGSDRYIKIKEKLLSIKGVSSCLICGYNKNIGCLDFHHNNPKEKDFKLNVCDSRKKGITWERILLEMDKCSILCANCHIKNHIKIEKFNSLKEEIYKRASEHKENTIPANKEIVMEMYKNNIRQIDIAKALGYSKGTISGIIKKHHNGI